MNFSSCNKIKNTAKKALNKGGETVGKTATEIVEGVTEGVEKTLKCDIKLSDQLKNAGLRTGTYSIRKDSNSVNRNVLTLYLIFEKDFNKKIIVKALNKWYKQSPNSVQL